MAAKGRISEVVLLYILEVLVGTYLYFCASSLIADNDSTVVLLQGRNSPNLSDRTFDGSLESAGLVVAVAYDKHLFGIEDGTHTDCKGGLGNLVYIVIEEAAVGNDRIGSKALLTGTARKENGSLKAMCPSGPIPPIKRSIPPAALMAAS